MGLADLLRARCAQDDQHHVPAIGQLVLAHRHFSRTSGTSPLPLRISASRSRCLSAGTPCTRHGCGNRSVPSNEASADQAAQVGYSGVGQRQPARSGLSEGITLRRRTPVVPSLNATIRSRHSSEWTRVMIAACHVCRSCCRSPGQYTTVAPTYGRTITAPRLSHHAETNIDLPGTRCHGSARVGSRAGRQSSRSSGWFDIMRLKNALTDRGWKQRIPRSKFAATQLSTADAIPVTGMIRDYRFCQI